METTLGPLTSEIEYAYDPFGRRIAKTVKRDIEPGDREFGIPAPRTIRYVYDNEDVILEYLKHGDREERTASYLHGPGIDEPLVVERRRPPLFGNGGFETFDYLADGLGSVTGLTDSKGRLVQRYEYASFGNPVAGNLLIGQPYAFTGREYDPETGFYYYRARYYDPRAGRFITKDPIGFEGGDVNLYAYVLNNPIKWTDPLGLAGCYVDYPGYPIAIPGTNIKVLLNHAGVLSYDSQGHTRYYEYGRYDSNFGNVRRRTVPDLQMGPDGKPTPESWAKLQYVLNKIGNGTMAKTRCNDKADADKINHFAEQRMNDPGRAPYSWNPFKFNTCTTFAVDALEAGLK